MIHVPWCFVELKIRKHVGNFLSHCIWGSDGCKYYWSRPGDSLKPHHIDVTVKHGGGSLMMWGCMTYDGPNYACQIYDGTMDSELYQHILDTSLSDTMEYYGYNWSEMYFQHDGDPKHRSKSTIKWLKDNNVRYIDDWPAQSPDLNPDVILGPCSNHSWATPFGLFSSGEILVRVLVNGRICYSKFLSNV